MVRATLFSLCLLRLTTLSSAAAEPLSLATVWQRALAASPEAQVLDAERAAITATAEQAGRLPNPTLGTQIENVGVKRPYRGVDDAELTVQLRQELVRRSKRDAARQFAEADRPIAEAEYRIRIADLRRRVVTSYNALYLAQEQAKLADQAVDLAARIVHSLQRQHEAGQATGVELSRALLESATAKAKAETAAVALAAARRALIAQWGGDVMGEVEAIEVAPTLLLADTPPLETFQAKLSNSPELRRLEAESERRRAEVAVEKQRPVRDIGVAGGVRLLRRDDTATVVLGVDIPILAHNRYEGAIAAARARERQLEHQKSSATLALRAELAARYTELTAAQKEASALDQSVLPAAADVVARNQAAFDQAQVSFLQLLEAQRALLAAREQRLAALGRYLEASVAIERLIDNVT